jgi:uncharacterized protein (DUF433 family)
VLQKENDVSVSAHYPHLTSESDGVVRIGRSRYKVLHLAAEHYQYGWTAEELMRQHPDLRPEEVYAALTYFYDHRDVLISELKRSLRSVEGARPAQPLSRDELIDRQASSGS